MHSFNVRDLFVFYFNLGLLLLSGLCSQLNGQIAESGQNPLFEKVYEQHLKQLHYLNEFQPKLLILFSGTPGMGKTTVARALEDHFHAVRVSSDEGRAILRQFGEEVELVYSYIEWLLPKLEANFANHCIIVDRSIDRTFPFYAKYAQDHAFEPFLIRMKLDRKENEEELLARKKGAKRLLRGSDNSWRDYENFSKTHTPDFVFDNSGSIEKPLQQLEKKIEALLASKRLFFYAKDPNEQFATIRAIILKSANLTATSVEADMYEILPGLYLGNCVAGENVPEKITRLLCCRTTPIRPVNLKCGWKKLAFADASDSKISRFFDESYDYIDRAQGPVLVHCNRGVSRSTSLVIAYLMKKFDVSFDAAFQFVKKKCPRACPEPNFQQELREYEKRLAVIHRPLFVNQ